MAVVTSFAIAIEIREIERVVRVGRGESAEEGNPGFSGKRGENGKETFLKISIVKRFKINIVSSN